MNLDEFQVMQKQKSFPIVKEYTNRLTTACLMENQKRIWNTCEESPSIVHEFLTGRVFCDEDKISKYVYAIIGEAFIYLAETDRLNDFEFGKMITKLMKGGEF